MRRQTSETKGLAWVTKDLLGPLLPEENYYHGLLQSLLEKRTNTQDSLAQNQALELLWRLTFAAASFGVKNLNIQPGFIQFDLPAVPAIRLVKLGIITEEKAINRIKTREEMRTERGKPPPENRVIVKSISNSELELEEHYTVTFPEEPTVELDIIDSFQFNNQQGETRLLFVKERQVPHAHALVAGQWLRIDEKTHPDFRLPPGLELPQARSTENPLSATNEEIAILLALVVEGIKEAREENLQTKT